MTKRGRELIAMPIPFSRIEFDRCSEPHQYDLRRVECVRSDARELERLLGYPDIFGDLGMR